MILYHFTSKVHLPIIEETGLLQLTESNIHMTISHFGPDVVWFTTEPTANLGHGLQGALDKTAVRFTVDVPDHWVKPWLPWAESQGMDPEWMDYLVEAGGGREAAETWMVTFRPVRKDRWVAIDKEPRDALGTYTVHDPDCSCTFIQKYQPISRNKEES